ncbi:MAG: AsmA-like C-terminal region-containing protein [Bacteroidales bacterium]|jgi:cell division septum initiation protein DivIVA|nr:AsmA-like C-terminal region-containing protein [Bacteroidales bacterium]
MKALKIFGIFMLIIIALVVISMFVIPQFYKDRIAKIVKTEINKQVKAKVDFVEFDLSLFRSFPDFSFGLHDISVINQLSDTLMTSDDIIVTMGLFSVLKDESIIIKSISIDRPGLFLKINSKGEENWNIIKETDPTLAEESDDADGYRLLLNSVLINEANIYYRDLESGIDVELKSLNASLKGSLEADRTDLKLKMNSDDFNVIYDGVAYMRHTALGFDAVIDANLKDEIYNLKNNTLSLNGLRINFEGSMAFVNDNINLMLVYNAPDNSFRQLLSLIPEIYKDGYDEMLTSGQFNMDGHIKGVYSNNNIPDFKLHMHAEEAEISYPNMPANVSDINFDLLVENEGNDLDNTIVKLDKLSGKLGEEMIRLSMQLLHPISDPYLDLKASAEFTFENLKNVFPQQSLQNLTGGIIADITLKGRLSSIEKKEYQNFRAMGSLVCDRISFDVDENYAILLKRAQFNFSPAQIDIIGFDSEIGGYSLLVDGKINNYLGYFLRDEMFESQISLRSETLNINQLLEPWSASDSDAGSGQIDNHVIYIPENIDVLVSITADSLFYDQLSFSDFNSTIHINGGKIEFEEFGSSFLGGLIEMNGYYVATASVKPHIDMRLKLMDLGVSSAYQYLSLFEKFVPIAERAKGIFDASVNLNMDLDQDMNPVWSSILGNGDFISDDIELNATEIFSRISKVLNVDAFKNPSTGPIDLSFNIMDGKIYNKPFNIMMDDIQMEVLGWTGLNQQIDYNLTLDIPVKLLGNDASKVIDQYAKEIGKLGFDLGDVKSIKPVLKVDGLASDPQVTLVSLGKLTDNNIKDIAKDKIEKVVDDYLEKANKEAERILAEAQKESDSIIAAAQKRVDKVMQLANQTVNNIKSESQKQADQLVKEAAKQGALAELAAKKAAEELLKSANKEAGEALSLARQESDQIMENARKQADATMQRAMEKSDMIRKNN